MNVNAHSGRGRAKGCGLCLVAQLMLVAVSGCTTYQVVPAPSGPSKFDRSWNAGLAAVEDVGGHITSADRASGIILAYKDAVDITVEVRTQADGSVRVALSARGPQGQDAALAERLSNAYDRRMGR